MDEKSLRKAFGDIVRGYSAVSLDDKFYIKHFGTFDQIYLDDIYKKNYDEAKKASLPTEKEKLEYLRQEGSWTELDEATITNAERTIRAFEDNISKITSPSHVRNLRAQQNQEREGLNKKLAEKNQILGLTCEAFAAKRTNDYYVFQSFYKDENLTIKLYDQEEFEYLSDKNINNLILEYNKVMSLCSGKGLKMIASSAFFQNVFCLVDDIYHFYGKPIALLTFCQLELAIFGRYFKQIFEENPELPERVRANPEEITDFITVRRNVKQIMENSKGGAVGFSNMTPEDLKELNLQHHMDNTHENLRKSGKKFLTAEDLYKLNN